MMRRLWLAGLTVLLCGCSHSPVATEHSLFPPVAADTVLTADASARITVVIVACIVPQAIDRPQFVLTSTSGAIRVVESHRWIEPLKLAIPRTVARYLEQALPEAAVWSSPGAAPARPDIEVRIEVAAWQADLEHRADIDLLWQVRRAGSTRSGRSPVSIPLNDATYEALVHAHRRALALASVPIAAAARSLLRESLR